MLAKYYGLMIGVPGNIYDELTSPMYSYVKLV